MSLYSTNATELPFFVCIRNLVKPGKDLKTLLSSSSDTFWAKFATKRVEQAGGLFVADGVAAAAAAAAAAAYIAACCWGI